MPDTKKLRQTIPGIVNDRVKELEHFQNEVLRPIIKTQHDVLILFYQNYLKKRKIDLVSLSEEKKDSILKSSFTRDISCKNQVVGMIIGQFDVNEFQKYSSNTSEYNKRILQIVAQRLIDSSHEWA